MQHTTKQNLKKRLFSVSLIALVVSACQSDMKSIEPEIGLKDAYADKFLVGATMNDHMVADHSLANTQIVKKHFSSATMDNSFKWGPFNPEPNIYNLTGPNNFADFTHDNGITPVGHVLYWHSQTPDWVFKDGEGNLLTRDALLQRMRERAKFMAKHFGDKIKVWDVVNEAIEDDGSLRRSLYNKIIGDDFIEQAFIIANEELPADAVKLYNDYGMTRKGRVSTVIKMVNDFKARNIPIDAIGIQGHWSMKDPSVEEIDANLTALAATGLKLHITELDVDYLGRENLWGANVDLDKIVANAENNPYPDGNFPASADKALGDRYAEIFTVFLKHHENIDRVTFWGVTDADSWLNSWPVAGRTNYPLLFNRDASPKNALEQVISVGLHYK
ncbi:endo-1,4-beta-xylanase [Paraglaciecola aquimarina]|uniref:Beta-xylanase n=1 Tax=Paraglaciecola aquimarina TaxID=1235557 RepID=A0ABU3SXL1_9ALTE|nr:endo-1,4-beta-xylanase [Paraglaciecola aquimarina]MDU0354741.1 endo-1,4-beta-xylanase [Paraglaciecola aquimarina]